MRVIQKLLLALLLCFAGVAVAADAVNINTADADTLVKLLKGVGPEKRPPLSPTATAMALSRAPTI